MGQAGWNETNCLWPTLSSVCSNAVFNSHMWQNVLSANSAFSVFVLLCWSVQVPKTLYYEFWINLSFGRLWHSGDLWEWLCFSCDISTASHFLSLSSGWYLVCAWLTLLSMSFYAWLSSLPSLVPIKPLCTDSSYYKVRQSKLLSALLFWNRTSNGNRAARDHPRWEESPGGGSQPQRTEYSRRKVR